MPGISPRLMSATYSLSVRFFAATNSVAGAGRQAVVRAQVPHRVAADLAALAVRHDLHGVQVVGERRTGVDALELDPRPNEVRSPTVPVSRCSGAYGRRLPVTFTSVKPGDAAVAFAGVLRIGEPRVGQARERLHRPLDERRALHFARELEALLQRLARAGERRAAAARDAGRDDLVLEVHAERRWPRPTRRRADRCARRARSSRTARRRGRRCRPARS